jgi:hypothetical protein
MKSEELSAENILSWLDVARNLESIGPVVRKELLIGP